MIGALEALARHAAIVAWTAAVLGALAVVVALAVLATVTLDSVAAGRRAARPASRVRELPPARPAEVAPLRLLESRRVRSAAPPYPARRALPATPPRDAA